MALELDVCFIDNYIRLNRIKEVTSSFIIAPDGTPDNEGIFSYDIFGRIGSEDRSINFGYIDLKRKFIHPLIFNAILQMYRALPEVIRGERFVKVGPNGNILTTNLDDPDAETGVDFFINNWDKFVWDKEDSRSREKKSKLFETLSKEEIFITKWLVIPAMYRDINLHSRSSGKINMDEINKFYIRLLNTVNSESITFTSSYTTQSNAQSIIVELHDYLTKKTSGKEGIIRKAIMGKTVDYAITNVISAPRFNADNYKDQMIPFNYIGVPLNNICALFYPLVIKQLEDMFFSIEQSTQFTLNSTSEVFETTEEVYEKVSSESIKKLVSAYINDKTKAIRSATFSLIDDGSSVGTNFKNMEKRLGRPFTVTDLLYMAIGDIVFNKHILSTRFPITGSESTIMNKIRVLTTEQTIDLANGRRTTYIDKHNSRFPYFPVKSDGSIDHKKIKWIDTVVPNNATLPAMGGDYDGNFFVTFHGLTNVI